MFINSPFGMDNIIEFITRRFSVDCNWLSGNCYYFATILKDRFPDCVIMYEQIYGHFFVECHGKYYDWSGEIVPNSATSVVWDTYGDIDPQHYNRIQSNCIS